MGNSICSPRYSPLHNGSSPGISCSKRSRVYDNEVYDRSIDVQVLRLRRKIEIDPSQPQFILTERGVGYSFNSPVEILY